MELFFCFNFPYSRIYKINETLKKNLFGVLMLSWYIVQLNQGAEFTSFVKFKSFFHSNFNATNNFNFSGSSEEKSRNFSGQQ